jgi:hypothetical protein
MTKPPNTYQARAVNSQKAFRFAVNASWSGVCEFFR